jgi:hypothetical protein
MNQVWRTEFALYKEEMAQKKNNYEKEIEQILITSVYQIKEMRIPF